MAASGFDLFGGSGGGGIRGVQRVSGIIGFSDLTINVNISPVDLNRSIVLIKSVSRTQSFDARHISLKAKFTSPASVELSRLGVNVPLDYELTVVEFESLKSLQVIEASTSAASTITDVPISPVDPDKTLIIYNYSNNSTAIGGKHVELGQLISTDTIRFTKHTTGIQCHMLIQVVEFD